VAGGPGRSESWPPLPPGTALTVVKLAPDGTEVTRYPGTVLAAAAPAPWLAVAARWRNRRVDLDGLAFVPGDTLREFFSPVHPFNAFAVVAPDGRLRGWYANVTHPTALDLATDPPTLTWHDLFVDVVALPDGTVTVRDEDELADAALEEHDPALQAAILAARDEILARLTTGAFPFHAGDRVGASETAAAGASDPVDSPPK
jgi:predicted RNA-binding protein associated with RNAse of E/G family